MGLLEREGHFTGLESALAEASAGAGRIALVSGEAGIGKTSLVERFTHRQRNTVRVLWGACDSLFTPRPLGPLHDMAGKMGGNIPELLSTDAPRTAIFSAVLSELQQGTAIVVFEDVHWADEATLDLLRYVGRRIQQTPALLVLTYRDDELGPRHPLRSVLGDLVSSSATRRILLAPLSKLAVCTLIGEREVDATALHRQSGGNPFFVTEVLANPTGGISPTIRDAVLARAVRLSLSAHVVLEAAAIIGLRVEPWLLAEVTGAEASAADECIAAGMLLAQGEMLAFRHELAQQTILATISPPRRQVLHQMVLDSLKSSRATHNDLARLAHHAEAAGDGEAVLEYAPAAARQAAAASAHREAAALYALALRYADDLPPDEQAQLLELYAQECNFNDQRFLAIDMLRKALDLWRKLDRPVKQGNILAQMSSILIGLGKDEEAEACVREAITLLEAHPPGKELAYAYRVQAGLNLIYHNIAEAMAWAEKVIALAERIDEHTIILTAQNMIGSAWMALDFERGCRLLEENYTAAHAAGLMATAAHTYANLGSISSELHQFRQAEGYLDAGIAYAAEYDLSRYWHFMLAWQAYTQLHLGKWREAAEAAGIVLQQAGVSTASRITALVALGSLHTRQGDPRANNEHDEALDLSRSIKRLDRVGLVRAKRAEAAWLAGDLQRALDEASAVYELAASKQHPWFTGELAFWRWRAGEKVEIPSWTAKPFALQIAGKWRAAAKEWERLSCPYEQARALADGDTAAQIRALEIFERLGAQPAANALRQTLRAAGAPQLPRKPRSATRENPFGLTDRQMEILSLLVEGLSNAEIGARLHISPKTADHHVSAVLAKLDARSREDASALARQNPHFYKK